MYNPVTDLKTFLVNYTDDIAILIRTNPKYLENDINSVYQIISNLTIKNKLLLNPEKSIVQNPFKK